MGQKCFLGLLITITFGLLGWLAGCGQDAPASRPPIEKQSQSGERQFLDACEAYQAIEFEGLCGSKKSLALAERVQKPLLAARTNDPHSALFATKLGDVLLEISPTNADQANAAYGEALKLAGQDWPPAWLGLAQVAIARGDFSRAQECIHSATQSIASLQNGYNSASAGKTHELHFMGITLNPDQASAQNGGKSPDKQRYEMTIVELQVYHLWSITSGGIYKQWAQSASIANPEQALRDVRAQIEWTNVQLMRAAKEPPDKILDAYERVYAQNPDLALARLDEAQLFVSLGRYNDADRLMNSYIKAENPAFSANPRVLLQAATMYNQWFLNPGNIRPEDRVKVFDNGEEVLMRLLSRQPNQPQALYLLAKHMVDGGLVYRKAAALTSAKYRLSCIKETDCIDNTQIQALNRRADEGLAELQSIKSK